jgi:hypothetical protein
VGDDNDTSIQSSLLWALTYNINIDVSAYLTGYIKYPANSNANETSPVAGPGSQWSMSIKIAFNGLYATALTDQLPEDMIQISLSFAF